MGISIRRSKDMGSVSLSMPTGIVNPFAGATAPSGWLLCDGTEKAIASYPELYSLLTTIYGALTNGSGGAGSTHFRVPDLRGRTVAGKDDMGGSAASRLTSTVLTASNTLGATGGTQTHTLASGESGVPAHGHPASSGNDSPDHSHGAHGGTFDNGVATVYTNRWSTANGFVRDTGGASTRHTHTVTVSNNTAANAGSAHLNTQPTMVLNYIIKA